jgi:hypothetical protein
MTDRPSLSANRIIILAQYEDLRLYINNFGLMYTTFVDLKFVNSHALAALVACRLYLCHKIGFKTQFLAKIYQPHEKDEKKGKD